MSSPALELFLAKLYVDEQALKNFLANPKQATQSAGLTATECVALEKIDRAGLLMAVNSFSHKRQRYQKRKPSFLARFTRLFHTNCDQ